jgi:hypothetical protein
MTPNALTVIEADGLLNEVAIGLAVWEEVTLSACLIDYALKHGLPQSADCDYIRAQAREKYPTSGDRQSLVLKAFALLLAEYNKPNVCAPHKTLVERAKNTLEGVTL